MRLCSIDDASMTIKKSNANNSSKEGNEKKEKTEEAKSDSKEKKKKEDWNNEKEVCKLESESLIEHIELLKEQFTANQTEEKSNSSSFFIGCNQKRSASIPLLVEKFNLPDLTNLLSIKLEASTKMHDNLKKLYSLDMYKKRMKSLLKSRITIKLKSSEFGKQLNNKVKSSLVNSLIDAISKWLWNGKSALSSKIHDQIKSKRSSVIETDEQLNDRLDYSDSLPTIEQTIGEKVNIWKEKQSKLLKENLPRKADLLQQASNIQEQKEEQKKRSKKQKEEQKKREEKSIDDKLNEEAKDLINELSEEIKNIDKVMNPEDGEHRPNFKRVEKEEKKREKKKQKKIEKFPSILF
jgi:hypothetical protein